MTEAHFLPGNPFAGLASNKLAELQRPPPASLSGEGSGRVAAADRLWTSVLLSLPAPARSIHKLFARMDL